MIDPRTDVLSPSFGNPDRHLPVDTDRPGWGPGEAVAVWLLSVVAIFAAQFVAVFLWIAQNAARTGKFPSAAELNNPSVILFTVISTVFAHLVTIGLCWMLVRKMSKEGFLASLGWHWTPNFRWYHAVIIAIGFLGVAPLLDRFIPSRETDFAKILGLGKSIRIAVAVLAFASAPLVEEVVYRGVLFAGLRKRFTRWTTVALVSLLFLLVHVPQYWGGWSGLVLLGLLSITLTVIRAFTGSILPGFFIHMIFNGIQAFGIVFLWDKMK